LFLKEISDDFLIELYREGNQIAIDLLFERYHKFIYGIIRDLFKNETEYLDYEELFQDSMIVFISCINKYDVDNGCFYFFVRKSIERKLRFITKKSKARKSVLSLDEYMYLDGDERKIDYIAEKENSNNLYMEIEDKLGDFENEIVRLKMEGYTYEEMASLLGIGKQSVYRKINKIKNILKDITKNWLNSNFVIKFIRVNRDDLIERESYINM